MNPNYDPIEHRQQQMLHACKRAQERFGLEVLPSTIEDLNKKIKAGEGKLVAIHPKGRNYNEVWDLEHDQLKLRVVFNARLQTACTMLTRDIYNPYWVRASSRQEIKAIMSAQGNLRIMLYPGQPAIYLYSNEGWKQFPRLLALYLQKLEPHWLSPERLAAKLVSSFVTHFQGKEDIAVNSVLMAPAAQTIHVYLHSQQAAVGSDRLSSFEEFIKEER